MADLVTNIKGPPGGIWYVSGQPYDTPGDVPSPHNGDMFIYPDSGDFFNYNNAAWTYDGSLRGPQGPKGDPGAGSTSTFVTKNSISNAAMFTWSPAGGAFNQWRSLDPTSTNSNQQVLSFDATGLLAIGGIFIVNTEVSMGVRYKDSADVLDPTCYPRFTGAATGMSNKSSGAWQLMSPQNATSTMYLQWYQRIYEGVVITSNVDSPWVWQFMYDTSAFKTAKTLPSLEYAINTVICSVTRVGSV